MTDLTRMFLEEFHKAPRIIVEQILQKKLQAQGIDDKALSIALAEHLMSGRIDKFVWDDNPYDDQSIEFTDEDADEILEAVQSFVKDIPNIIQNSVSDTAKDIVKDLERRWPEVKIYDRSEQRAFCDRLELRWGKGIDPLRMLLIASREVGENYAKKLAKSRAKREIAKRQVLLILHVRACQTALEILTLLEHGLSDGAYARWRTLYEISVVAFVIDQFGDDIAERYLNHDVVSMHEAMENELRFAKKGQRSSYSKAEQKAIKQSVCEAIREYGKDFSNSYGWASAHLGRKRPTFQHLEEAVNWDALPPSYKWSSYKVHAGIAGAVRSLGTFGEYFAIHAGASNAGLETPATNTAYTLVQITSLLYGTSKKIEDQIEMLSLCLLRDKVEKECLKAAQKLLRDERNLAG